MKSAAGPSMELASNVRRTAREQGQATLEIVVSLLVMMSLVFGLFEVCMLTYTCSVLNEAAQEGVRYAIVHGTSSSNCSGPDSGCPDQAPYSNVRAIVSSAASASLHDLTAMSVTVSYSAGTAAVGNPVRVIVVYTYIHLPGLHDTVSFSSQGQILY